MNPLTDWLTKTETAARLGVSTKAVERFAQAKKLEQRSRPQDRGPRIAVYCPEDVEKLARERQAAQPGPFVLPAPAPSTNGSSNGHSTLALSGRQMAPGEDALRALATALRAMSETSQTPALFLTIDEAAKVSGLSRTFLKTSIANGTLAAARDGRRWKIRRRDLETL